MKKNILIAISVVVLLIAAWIGFRTIHDKNLERTSIERTVAIEKIKQLSAKHAVYVAEIESMKVDKKILEAIIVNQRENPQIIIQKYEIEHKNIDNLSPSESYKLFTINIANYKANRGHYSLERFK